ncbi:MAG: response regulator [Balneolaceae bacterium]
MDSVHILLVEDNEGDVLLLSEAFEEARLVTDLTVVKDGERAIDFLERRGEYDGARRPNLVILDVNLPRKSGHEVLEHIKSSEHLKFIPVIMLTTSSAEQDVMKSYQNHANCYITKPVDMDLFLKAIAQLGAFWLELVRLPKSK